MLTMCPLLLGRRILVRGGGWAPDLLQRMTTKRHSRELRMAMDIGLNAIRLEGKLQDEDLFEQVGVVFVMNVREYVIVRTTLAILTATHNIVVPLSSGLFQWRNLCVQASIHQCSDGMHVDQQNISITPTDVHLCMATHVSGCNYGRLHLLVFWNLCTTHSCAHTCRPLLSD